jgi:hypothetical protein
LRIEISDLLYDAEHPEIAEEREKKRLEELERIEKLEKAKEKEMGHGVFKRQKAQGILLRELNDINYKSLYIDIIKLDKKLKVSYCTGAQFLFK